MTLKQERVNEIVGQFEKQRILVVGDLMLDRYIYGRVDRISPEAPVPVVQVSEERNMPGGASNVAWNVQSLGGRSTVCGYLGHDGPAGELAALLKKGGVSLAGVMKRPGARTTVKTRIIAEHQQVVRVDWDSDPVIRDQVVDIFCRKAATQVARSTGVIIEDYGKGVIQQKVVDAVLAAARKAGVPTGFDPKDNHALRVDGVTIATPNRREAHVALAAPEAPAHDNPLEDQALLAVARRLAKKWKPRLLVVTLGPRGMLLLSGAKPPRHIPTRAREVFDVSGAGDTVIATSVLALAAGASHEEAAELANYAAGVVVGKLGTATCSRKELVEYYLSDPARPDRARRGGKGRD